MIPYYPLENPTFNDPNEEEAATAQAIWLCACVKYKPYRMVRKSILDRVILPHSFGREFYA